MSRSHTKYRAVKTVVLGITFDSKAEAARYVELKALENKGKIKNLELQAEFELVPKQKLSTGKTERAVKYKADFIYELPDGKKVCEDVKGVKTKEYIIKRKLMKLIHNIEILETWWK